MARLSFVVGAFGVAMLAGCAGRSTDGATVLDSGARAPKVCDAPGPGTYGVKPLDNKSGHDSVNISGSDTLVMNEMLATGCFSLVEREKVAALVEEMSLCSDSNPDKEFFNCDSFAKKGKLLGISHLVLGDLLLVEPNVESNQVAAKIPGIGGLSAGQKYDAVAIELRVVEVETGKISKSVVTHAVVPSDEAGVDFKAGDDFQLKAMTSSHTPMGDALHTMFADAATKLH